MVVVLSLPVVSPRTHTHGSIHTGGRPRRRVARVVLRVDLVVVRIGLDGHEFSSHSQRAGKRGGDGERPCGFEAEGRGRAAAAAAGIAASRIGIGGSRAEAAAAWARWLLLRVAHPRPPTPPIRTRACAKARHHARLRCARVSSCWPADLACTHGRARNTTCWVLPPSASGPPPAALQAEPPARVTRASSSCFHAVHRSHRPASSLPPPIRVCRFLLRPMRGGPFSSTQRCVSTCHNSNVPTFRGVAGLLPLGCATSTRRRQGSPLPAHPPDPSVSFFFFFFSPAGIQSGRPKYACM